MLSVNINRKSHTGFQLVPILVTLASIIALILCFFSLNLIALQADCVTVVEDRPIVSAKYRIPVPFIHFWPKLMHPAIAERLVFTIYES